MAKQFQFGDFGDAAEKTKPHCAACEAMLADALDEVLSEADQAWFDAHVATCAECSQMLGDARRGVAWLELLKTPRPEPSAGLLDRILAQTADVAHTGDGFEQPMGAYVPLVTAMPPNVIPFPVRVPRTPNWGFGRGPAWLEPRLAMTAAMAFFSVALTLNLTGVKLDQLHASDLRPENLQKTFYQADAHAVRYYDNLRVVRVLESRVDEARGAGAGDGGKGASTPETERNKQEPERLNQEQKAPDKPNGMSRQDAPAGRNGSGGTESIAMLGPDPTGLAIRSKGTGTKEGGLA